MKRFITIFPEGKNIHLVKDVGMIPYILQAHFGYSSAFASYKNGEYPAFGSQERRLNHVIIPNVFRNPLLDVMLFLTFNFRRYDIINLFHLRARTGLWAIWFKFLTLNRGKVYLKLDCDDRIYDYKPKGIKKFVSNFIFSKIDVISVENKSYQKYLNAENVFNRQVYLLPNGYYQRQRQPAVRYKEKENLIITVGRIGAVQKATEVLCKAFALIAEAHSDWKLEVIGPVEDRFRAFIEEYFLDHPGLRKQVVFPGEIIGDALLQQYKRAKIFALTSRWEGFPIVLPEAISHGCYIIASDLPAAIDITQEGKYGDLFPVDDYVELSLKLNAAISNTHKLAANCADVQDFARTRFNWVNICSVLNEKIG